MLQNVPVGLKCGRTVFEGLEECELEVTYGTLNLSCLYRAG